MPRVPDDVFDDWRKQAAAVDLVEVARSRGAKLKRIGREFIGPCPVCGGKDRFSINLAKRIFNCRGSVGGDVIALVQHLDGVDFLQACTRLTGRAAAGEQPELTAEQRREMDERRARREREDKERDRAEALRRARRIETAQEIWKQCQRIEGTIAERYLHNRGIPTPKLGWPDTLGFHVKLEWEPGAVFDGGQKRKGGERYPALVGRVQHLDGETVAVHQIYLTDTGHKAKLDPGKVTRGPFVGGAIRLGGIGPRVNICEGLETGLAIRNLVNHQEPVWSCLGTAGIVAIELPLEVESVTGWPDGDKPIRKKDHEFIPTNGGAGIKASREMKERLTGLGLKCGLAYEPPVGKDYLDLYLAAREYGKPRGAG